MRRKSPFLKSRTIADLWLCQDAMIEPMSNGFWTDFMFGKSHKLTDQAMTFMANIKDKYYTHLICIGDKALVPIELFSCVRFFVDLEDFANACEKEAPMFCLVPDTDAYFYFRMKRYICTWEDTNMIISAESPQEGPYNG